MSLLIRIVVILLINLTVFATYVQKYVIL